MKTRKEHFNDLLLPVLSVLCIMPFIIRLAEYDYGYGNYTWHSDISIAQDLYTYYRSYFFLFIGIILALILIAYCTLYREKLKPSSFCIPLLIYSLTVVISTIFSVNTDASLKGNFYQFESVFVLIAYLLLFFYTYQIIHAEKDYRILFRGFTVTFLLLAITGIFQLFQYDLLNLELFQQLIMSPEQYKLYHGELETIFTSNNVFLTLFNPNYAGVFLTMSTSIFIVMTITESVSKKRRFYLVLTIISFILMWFTYSRSTIIALATGIFVLFIILGHKQIHTLVKWGIPIFITLFVILIIGDSCNHFKYLSRFIDTKPTTKLDAIITDTNGVKITYDSETYIVRIEKDSLTIYDSNNNMYASGNQIGEELQIPFSSPAICTFIEQNQQPCINLFLDNSTYMFIKENDSYYYYNENGKTDIMTDIPHINFHGLEHLGSGRLYIWSRTLPLLKDYILIGSGPDTFTEVFPQNDYVGKIKYADSSARIVEKAHNDFLMKWVQTGLVSLIALLIFYYFLLRKCIAGYRKKSTDFETSFSQRFGLGCFISCICYLTSCLFNDSTLFTTPFFWIFAGIALAGISEKTS